MATDFMNQLEEEARMLKQTGFLCDMEVFNTDEGGMLNIFRNAGGMENLPNVLASVGYPHSFEDNGNARRAFAQYLTTHGIKTDWTRVGGRLYFVKDEDAVMARCLA